MNTQTIVTPNFAAKIAKIIAEICTQTCIDDVEVKIVGELLKDELTECCDLLNQYYEEEYHNALASARSRAYDDGHSDGYSDGYDDGQSDGYDDGHSAV